MGFFECCHYCKAPKRYPGCHKECPDYIESKKSYEEYKEAERQEKISEPAMSRAHICALRAIRRKLKNNRRLY